MVPEKSKDNDILNGKIMWEIEKDQSYKSAKNYKNFNIFLKALGLGAGVLGIATTINHPGSYSGYAGVVSCVCLYYLGEQGLESIKDTMRESELRYYIKGCSDEIIKRLKGKES